MRVCVLTTSYPRFEGDDSSIFVQRLVDAYSEAGISGYVIVPRDRDEPGNEKRGNFEVRRYRYGVFTRGALAFGEGIMPKIRTRPLLAAQVPAMILMMAWSALTLQRGYEIVQANWIGAGISAWLLRLLCGKPYFLTVRGEDVKLLCRTWIGKLLWPVLHSAHAVTSVNQVFISELQQHFKIPKEKMHFIPNGVSLAAVGAKDREEFLQRRNLQSATKYIVSVGTVIPRKRVEVLIELLAMPELENFELLLCGRLENEVYAQRMRELAIERGVSKRVHFEGMVAPADIPRYLSVAHCYVSASEHEGRPNAIMEALVAKVPVFASDISAHREILGVGSPALFTLHDLQPVARRIREGNFTEHRVNTPTWADAVEKYRGIMEPC